MSAALLAALVMSQNPCIAVLDSAWRVMRAGAVDSAAVIFRRADARCPRHPGTQVGLGFIALRNGSLIAARARFLAATRLAPDDADAWYGLGLVYGRLEKTTEAVTALRRALSLAPGYADVTDALLALGADSGLAPAVKLPAQPVVAARTAGERFETRGARGWQPFYIKGINLGAALPGSFPTQFPTDDSTYARWLQLIAEANANTVRVYTILPPAFYRALARWNTQHADRSLWLVHGVWAEAPPRDDYDDTEWKSAFRDEMRRVVDVIHGRARVGARRGHAWGRYQADVSDRTLAFIIGREWEPATIIAYNAHHPRQTSYRGRFLGVASGSPADAWMAEQCDYLQAYEWDTYRAARPIAYTNWPTLDALHHFTEATLAEEAELRRKAGLPPNPRLKEYDNDAVGLDAMLVRATPANLGGYFAAFHAYPYYPDFIALDSSYAPSHYLGYLRALHAHHAGRPVVIAEYGVPSSRGMAHLGPEGQNHGGHNEQRMATIDVALTRDIKAAGMAGGMLFEWMDEWFKHNWAVIDFELPAERTPLWHNVEDAEQNYGLLGQYAGTDDGPQPSGDAGRWRALTTVSAANGFTIRAGSNESFLYLAIDAPGFDSLSYLLGIDTYRPDRGAHRLPGLSDRIETGVEFALIVSDATHAELRVARHYNPYLGPRPGMGPTALDGFYNLAATVDTQTNDDAFDSLFVTTNRFRIARDGTTFPARGVNRGRLRSTSDWFFDPTAKLIEVRLPWGLLNVTDPSSHMVLSRVRTPDPFVIEETYGLRFALVTVRRRDTKAVARFEPPQAYSWPRWETPRSHERLKPAYAAMQAVWAEK